MQTAYSPLPAGATIGILGGGQLGRMIAIAAAQLGYQAHAFCTPDTGGADSPCAQVCARVTVATYEDEAALTAFARAVDAATVEFEHIPLRALEAVARHTRLAPSPALVATCQDRAREKAALSAIGMPTAPYRIVHDAASLADALDAIGAPAILKRARFGYDGKGQRRIHTASQALASLSALLDEIGPGPAVLEGLVRFERELSVIVSRDAHGHIVTSPPIENHHLNHVLHTSLAPAPDLPPELDASARALAATIAARLELVGVLGVEFFVYLSADTPDHEGDPARQLIVNELAPRPHNSGHWTIEGASTSQFEQVVRAVAGLPLGSMEALAPCRMVNLLGAEVTEALARPLPPRTRCHIYGKAEARPGRKMGHVTTLGLVTP